MYFRNVTFMSVPNNWRFEDKFEVAFSNVDVDSLNQFTITVFNQVRSFSLRTNLNILFVHTTYR